MTRFFAYDECGAISGDWLIMSAGILALGTMVAYSVMGSSVDFLIEEIDALNLQYTDNGVKVSASAQQTQINR